MRSCDAGRRLSGFERLGPDIKLAACWAHARRKFYEVHQATASPIAAEALRRNRRTLRDRDSHPRPDSCRTTGHAPCPIAASGHDDEELASDAVRPHPTPWWSCGCNPLRLKPLGCLCCFLNDGRIELDTNTVERAIRPVMLGRKNHLFAGSDGGANRWATVCSLITTAKLNDVEPFAYLTDVLERMSSGHAVSRLDELLPWNWRPSITLN
jgi:hypothetical protein